MSTSHGIVVIGAGAAGFMAAIHAAGGHKPVFLLETTPYGGRKILISGGGRCNILPSLLDENRFHTDSSRHSLRNILKSWPGEAQRCFFEETLSLPLMLESDTGKLFPVSQKARQVRDKLKAHAERVGVQMVFDTTVNRLDPPSPERKNWQVHAVGRPARSADAVILATGGLSVPGTGSDGTGLRIARQLGHTIRPTYPALTPLTLNPPRYGHLAGISGRVSLIVPVGKGVFSTTGGFLFTHHGYSGPAVLDISHLLVRSLDAGTPLPLFVRWTREDAEGWDKRLRAGKGTALGMLKGEIPERLADLLLYETGIRRDTELAYLARQTRQRFVTTLTRFPLPWSGSEGYKKAEVTGGGVALEEVHPATMESRIHPGLFLCGELLDAFGPIGGYNFSWAWVTGRLAGMGAKTKTA